MEADFEVTARRRPTLRNRHIFANLNWDFEEDVMLAADLDEESG